MQTAEIACSHVQRSGQLKLNKYRLIYLLQQFQSKHLCAGRGVIAFVAGT